MSEKNKDADKYVQHESLVNKYAQEILETSIDGFCLVSANGEVLEANQVYCQMLGYSRDELVGMRITDIDAHETEEDTARHIAQVIRERYDRFETIQHTKDGEIIDVEVSVQYLEKTKIFICFFRDITAKKRIEDELKKFKTIADKANYGTAISDLEGNLTYVNKYFAEIHGYMPKELIGKNLTIFHNEEQIKEVLKINHRLKDAGKINAIEVQHVHKNGKVFPMLMNSLIIHDERNRPAYMATTAIDITASKHAEEALRESEQRYKTLFESAAEGILVVQTGVRKILYTNRCIQEMLGYSEDELKGMNVEQLHTKEGWEYIHSEFQSQKKGLKRTSTEVPFLRKDGTIVYADFNTALVNIDGKRCGIAFCTDITERKKADEALRESEARYKTLFEGSAEGILVAEIETKKFLYANPTACKMLGYTEEEIKRMYVNQIHPAEDWEYVLSEFDAQARGDKSLSTYLPCLRKDGTVIYVDVNAKKAVVGGVKCNVGFFADVTEYKRIKNELEKYKERILQAQKHAYVSSMGAIVAHQINQPLTKLNILLDRAAEQMEATGCCPDVLKDVSKGIEEVRETVSIIRKFRRYAKGLALETGGRAKACEVADKIIAMLKEKAGQANLKIYLRGLAELDEIDISEASLEQIFLIIVQNAIEAADGVNKHSLEISGRSIDGRIELRFSDDCYGIAEENLEKIFEPFFSTKTEEKGMGLGLDIVQQILLSYGGQIRVESEIGKGSCFFVTLPASKRKLQ